MGLPGQGKDDPKHNLRKINRPHVKATYVVDGTVWRIDSCNCLEHDLGVKIEDLPKFHKLAIHHPQGWTICRMLYGINLASLDPSDPSYMQLLSKPAVERAMFSKNGRKQFENILRELSEGWLSACGPVSLKPRPEAKSIEAATELVEEPAPVKKPGPVTPPALPVPAEDMPLLSEHEAHLFALYGFSDALFGNLGDPDRSVSHRTAERYWFLQRLRELKKVLDEPLVSTHVRHALNNELFSRRVSDKLCRLQPDEKEFQKLQSTKASLDEEYRDQWKTIESLCPFARQLSTKNILGGQVSDLVRAIQEYEANKNNDLVDGVRTSYGIQIQLRDAEQHGPRYRPGQTAYVLEAMNPANFWNPNWESQIPKYLHKAVDAGFKEGFARGREAAPLPNLELEGPASEYPALQDPVPEKTEEPETAVPINEPVLVTDANPA